MILYKTEESRFISFIKDNKVVVNIYNEKGEVVYDFNFFSSFSGSNMNIYNIDDNRVSNCYNLDYIDDCGFGGKADIIQLLVDLNNADNQDYRLFCEEKNYDLSNIKKTKLMYIATKRIRRFNDGFNKIFAHKISFKGINSLGYPVFTKAGNEIEIDNLSSGEKEIIYRGIVLLKNINILKGYPVFIDEPEISMHPEWQDKILNYYQSMYKSKNKQVSQMFFATHSDYILEQALQMEDTIIIKLGKKIEKYYKNCAGTILPKLTSAEIKYLIFDLYTIDFHCLLYGYITNNIVSLTVADPYITDVDKWMMNDGAKLKLYKYMRHGKICECYTLPTYIRNCIDHPDNIHSYSNKEFKYSIEYMINVIKKNP